METIQKSSEMQLLSLSLRQQGKKIGLVPTMGALHEGHLKLVDEAKKVSDVIIMTLFVNPTQFGPVEDFDKYPRDTTRDAAMAAGRGVDFLFLPVVQEIYPPGDQTQVVVTDLTRGLCGPFRPGHFRGVATVVAKLFLITQPHVAVFGEKDYQQLKVIQRMVKDLHFPIEVIGVPTVRETNGLAMSSRNSYLTEDERKEASHLFESILLAQNLVKRGIRDSLILREEVLRCLKKGGHIEVEYVEIVDSEELKSLLLIEKSARLIMAVHLNGKRLIDNGPLV